MAAVSKLYIDFMNLVGLDFYTKSESDEKYALKSEVLAGLTVDNSLSSSSSNPVQNKVIKSALDAKANSSHNHTKSEITDFPSIPDKISDLTNDSNFVLTNDSRLSDARTPLGHTHDTGEVKDTSAYSNIGSSVNASQKTINNNINTKLGEMAVASNVYSKSETYTRSEIITLISNAVSELDLFEVVEDLPTSNIKDNRLYLIVNEETIENNSYDIYLRVNNTWERIDALEFDISNFYTKSEIDTLLNSKVDTSDNRLTDSRTPKSHTHGDITNTGTIGTTANKPLITTTNGKISTGNFGTISNTFAEGNHNHGNLLTDGTLTTVKTSIVSNDKFAIIDSSNNKLSSASVVDVVNQLILDLITEANK